MIDHIVTDPQNSQHLIVGAWIPTRPEGGLFVSEDGGRSWYEQEEMRGQSIRSLARSPSSDQELIAGTLKGVFRTIDNGKHWQAISPEGSTEIHEVESVAIDPADPQVIYAGTWHLPWKTVDGGSHWLSIKQGIIEDSDVFSIIVDPANPKIVYASACSGIYKSTDGGGIFIGGVTVNKTQGIPVAARRTRKLAQDPQHAEIVYAGTTEGLYRSPDAGGHWDRMTGPDVIVNDVYIDPKDSAHVLLATDRGGVLSSEDAAVTFTASNTGFSARQIASYAADPHNQAMVYVGVVNDKATGGVFASRDGGVRWEQMSEGLGGRDVFSLAPTKDGALLAGTAHGVFRWEDGAWSDSNEMVPAPVKPAPPPAPARKPTTRAPGKPLAKGKPIAKVKAPETPPPPTRLDAVVYALAPWSQPSGSHGIYAGTSRGLMRSEGDGALWTPVASLPLAETRFVAVQQSAMLVASLKRIVISEDAGATWKTIAMPPGLTQVATLALDDSRGIWVGGSEGLFTSVDQGVTWTRPADLLVTGVDSLFFDATGQRMLVTSVQTSFVYSMHLPDRKINYWETGWKLRFARPVGDHLIGVTLFDGLVVQPRMVADSAAAAGR